MKKFDKKEYDKNYRKQHKAQFNVDLNKEELDKANKLLKDNNITKVEFIRLALKSLEDGTLKKEE